MTKEAYGKKHLVGCLLAISKGHSMIIQDPHGRDYFWLTGKFNNAEPDAEDSDEWALAHGYVAVVPVQVDMTDYRMLSALPDILP